MSLIDTWRQVLPESRKRYMHDNLRQINHTKLQQIRILLTDISLPTFEDETTECAAVLQNQVIGHLEALQFYMLHSKYWWHIREWVRFVVNYHRPVPSVAFNLYANFAGQFPHVSREDSSRIAIVMDIAKANQDVHTTMKIGRYLSKQTSAPESALPDISNEFATRNNSYMLEEAKTPAQIQWVYENGPSSCMGKTMFDGVFHTRTHPTHGYATPDIKILYVRDLNNPNRVISRTVVSAINKKYIRIFGNAGIMVPLLAKADYTNMRSGGLNNHRLLKIVEVRDGVTKHVGPYLDSGKHNIHEDPDDEKYLIINPQGDPKTFGKHVGSTERSYTGKGFIDTPPTISCHHCGSHYAQQDITFHEHAGYHACRPCMDQHMVRVLDDGLASVYVDSVYSDTHTTKIIVNIQHYLTDTGEPKIRKDVREWYFLNEETFLNANLRKYRKEEDIYLAPDESVYIENHKMYVLTKEVTSLSYTDKVYLKEDCTVLEHMYVANEHVKDGAFKYTTLGGFDTEEILNELSSFYFVSLADPNMNRLVISQVSKKNKPGFTSYGEYWESRQKINAKRDPFSDPLPTKVTAYVIPDNADNKLFTGSLRGYQKFRTNKLCARKIIHMYPSNTIQEKPKKKRTATIDFTDGGTTWAAFDTSSITTSTTSSTF